LIWVLLMTLVYLGIFVPLMHLVSECVGWIINWFATSVCLTVLSCLVLSCLVLSCLVLSCLVLSCLVLSCPVSACQPDFS
jgi:hypothetical protein